MLNFMIYDEKTTTECSCVEGVNRHNCTKCFGSGFICLKCQNTGRDINNPQEECGCNVLSQNRYYGEMKHYHNQTLIRVSEINSNFEISSIYKKLLENGFVISADGEYRNHFGLVYTNPSYFVQHRMKYLQELAAKKARLSHGFVYVPAVSLVEPLFLKNLENINAKMNENKVYVILGLSDLLPNIEFNYLRFISTILKYPFFIFSNYEFIKNFSFNFNLATIEKDTEPIVKKRK